MHAESDGCDDQNISKFVYGLNLNDLPLDRLTEQKVKRLKGTRGT